MQKKAVASVASLVALAAGLAAAAQRAKSSPLTSRFARSAKIWKLSARNSTRFAVSKVRGFGSPEERRAELDQQFAIRTAEDVAKELGEMKGVLMKAGQLISFIFEALPDEAQEALATLQADAAPMAPTLAADVVKADLGRAPERVFLEWGDMPVAAASIGQVHRAVTPDGRDVAVKVQYPGVQEAIESDLDAAEVMYAMFSAMMLKGLDAKGLVDELRARMREELDYRLEARNITEFEDRFQGHPWVRIPKLVPEFSHRAPADHRVDRRHELRRVPQDRVVRHQAARRRGDLAVRPERHLPPRRLQRRPAPGQLQVPPRRQRVVPRLRPRQALDAGRVGEPAPDDGRDHHRPRSRAAGRSGWRRRASCGAGHGLDPELVYDYVSSPYTPYLTDEFTFTREWMRDTLGVIFDVQGPHGPVIEQLNMPPSFVILDRVVWGVSAILGKLEAHGPWRAMLLEYTAGGPPATDLGAAEAAWSAGRPVS